MIKEFFLSIVRLGVGKGLSARIPQSPDWEGIEAMAVQHGLSAILIDGIESLPEEKRPPKEMLLQWIGESLHGDEYRYVLYRRAIADLAAFYNNHGYKMMVLKGYACSLDWPKPEHRPCGDIDIWLFGKQKEADICISKKRNVIVDNSHHHHTVFEWRDFVVENHYDFVNTHTRKSSIELEAIFKELGADDSHFVDLYGEMVYLPSANLHALFLMRHMVAHFSGANITLRQVLDWAFFVEKHTKEVDWKWLMGVLEEYHMKDFFNCINAICVEDLGFDASLFSSVQLLPSLKEKIFQDIISPQYTVEEPSCLLKRLSYKYKRWRGNAWKQELCFNENRSLVFLKGIWAKILKPASF